MEKTRSLLLVSRTSMEAPFPGYPREPIELDLENFHPGDRLKFKTCTPTGPALGEYIVTRVDRRGVWGSLVPAKEART